MKALIQIAVLVVAGLIIAFVHPFGLAMPWQGGSAVPVTDAVLDIVSAQDFEIKTLDWGRPHPFTFVSADGEFTGRGHPATTCSDLRTALADWGRVTDIQRRSDGCDIEAQRGSMQADLKLRVDGSAARAIVIDLRVAHTD